MRATAPDSKAPSSFDALMNTHSTALTRPCSCGGVSIVTAVWRMLTLIMSTKPVTQSAASESGSHFESPNTIIPPPNIATTTRSVGPAGVWSGFRASSTAAASAPTDGAVRRRPSPIGPVWRIDCANTGASAIESPSSTPKRSSPIAPSSMRVRAMKRTPATRLSQPGGSVVTSDRTTGRMARTATSDKVSRPAAVAYTATGSTAKMTPPSAGPAITPIWPATPRRASAPGSSSRGTSSGVSARSAGLPTTFATPATAAIARNGQSDLAPARVTKTSSTAIATLRVNAPAVTARRGSAIGDLPRRQREDRQRQELHQPDEPEVERMVVDRVDLPADRDREHLRRQPVREQGRPEEPEVADPQRGREALPHAMEVRLRRMADAHETTQAKLEWLRELRDEALHAGSEGAVQKRRDEGRLLARERAEKLCDPGSFVELDRYVRHRESNFGMMDRRPYGDAVVTGYGTVFGRKVFVFSQDFTVFGGSLSEVFAEKICKVMDLAVKYGCP